MQSYNGNQRRQPRPQTFRPSRPAAKPSAPANSPWRSAPLPGNANSPFAPRPISPHKPLLPMLGRGAGKFIPYLGWLILAYEIYNLFWWKPGQGQVLASGWHLMRQNTHTHFTANRGGIEYLANSPSPTYASYADADAALNDYQNQSHQFGLGAYGNPNYSLSPSVWAHFQAREYCNAHIGYTMYGNSYLRAPNITHAPYTDDPMLPIPYSPTLPALEPWVPALNPQAVPPLRPTPHPFHVPWRIAPYVQPDPWASPTEQSQRGYAWYPLQDPFIDPLQPKIAPNPKPDEVALEYPPIIFELTPVGSRPVPATGRAGKYHSRRPPDRGEREKKVGAGGVLATFGRYVLQLTELNDLLEALIEAMPRELRPSDNATLYDKAQAVYDHMDDIDVADAIRNLIENQIEDTIIGRGQAGARSNLSQYMQLYGSITPTF